MRKMRYSLTLALWACAGMLMPCNVALAGEPAVSNARANAALGIEDVALGDHQTFQGVLLADNGQPVADTDVILSQLGREVARTTTDSAGRFAFQGLRGGLHLVHAGQGAALYRLWTKGTAPPHAKSQVSLVDTVTIRGQRPLKNLLMSNTVIVTAIVGAAIAIPIAVHDARNEKKSGS